MSLEALNNPTLVGALTAGSYALLPLVAKRPLTISFMAVKGLNVASYGLGLSCVSQPGRYDGAAAAPDSKSIDADARRGMEQMGPSRGRTLVPPAPWAFVIWAPIFLGEFLMVTTPLVRKVSPVAERILRESAGPFALAQVFTALWTVSFRPKYGSKGGIYKYVSALALAGMAASLSICHKTYAGSSLRGIEYVLYGLPVSLHFGWTTAASLVNLNGMFALSNDTNRKNEAEAAKSVALLGHLSVVAATAIGVTVTLTRQAPVYGGVICWALSAVASGLKKRIENVSSKEKEGNDAMVVGVYGVKRQRILSQLGALVCAGAVVASLVR